jgi:hypothetical protein
MPHRKTNAEPSARQPASPFERALSDLRHSAAPPPVVSGRWLLAALGIALLGAVACAWCTLCFLFWQGSWQLLYHPVKTVARTPASIGLAFDPAGFASTEAGVPQLAGWWIPAGEDAPFSRTTVLYLHGPDGNIASTLDDLDTLHAAGVNVLAFDYRGYGQSQFVRPSEAHWRQDAEWALLYLTGTRHVAAGSIILDGTGLGANLALEISADHPELRGVVLRQPLRDPVDVLFNDPRSTLVPARLLMRDRFDWRAPALRLRIPSLWLLQTLAPDERGQGPWTDAFLRVSAPKRLAWLRAKPLTKSDSQSALARWLDDLPGQDRTAGN